MEKVFLLRGDLYIRVAIIYGLVFAPVFLGANDYNRCVVCEEEIPDEGADLELFEEFERAFEEFDKEAVVEEEDDSEAHKKGFLKKWTKKLKKWFAKKIYKIFKKIAGVKKIKNSEDCAYAIAKFKRKMDKKFSKHLTVDEMFQKFDEHTENFRYNDMVKFKDRIKFYHKNKHEKPPQHHQDGFDEHSKELEKVPMKVMLGGVGIFCGTIIMFIPLPGCYSLGKYVIETGIGLIAANYIDQMIDSEKKPEEIKE